MKQEATASLLITQLLSCSLVWSPHMLLVDPFSLCTRAGVVERAPRPTFDRVASNECTCGGVLFREIALDARLLRCRVVSVRVGVIV